MKQAQREEIRQSWRSVFEPPPTFTVSEWAERNVVLDSKTHARPGPLHLSHSPYCREPMDAFSDPDVREITCCFASQTGKTIIMYCTMGYAIDYDPSPGMIVFGNADQAKEFSKDKLKPFIENCPSLSRHLTARREDFATLDIRLDRMNFYLEGAASPTNLASRSVRFLWLDELEKYPSASAKEAASPDLCEKRTRTFKGREKIFKSSTPTIPTGEIWQSFLAGDQRRYHVPCPYCQAKQILKWANVIYPNDAKLESGRWDKERILRETYYKCEECGGKITERYKHGMINAGEWRPADPTLFSRHRSYQLSALYSTFETWGSLAVKWIEAQGNKIKLKAFIQNELGEPWEERGEVAGEEVILKRREPYKPGECPCHPIRVIITADVQKHCCWYAVRAWGRYETSWLLDYGMVPGLDGLEAIRRDSVFDGLDGEEVRITNAFIDSGAFTDDVYRFCKQNRWMPVKGFDSQQQTQPLAITKLPQFGLMLLRVNVDFYKEALQVRIATSNDQPGAWLLHEEVDETYTKHLTAEELVEDKKPKKSGEIKTYWKQIRPDNHLGDCEVYQLAAAQHLRVRHMAEPPPEVAAPREPENPKRPFVRTPERPAGQPFVRRIRR